MNENELNNDIETTISCFSYQEDNVKDMCSYGIYPKREGTLTQPDEFPVVRKERPGNDVMSGLCLY